MSYTSRLKTIELWFLLILPFFMPLSGVCADADGSYMLFGVGTTSCGSFAQARRESLNSVTNSLYNAWVGGYITAVNYLYTDTYHIAGTTDLNGLMMWLENYCNKNPLKYFAQAVEEIIHELYTKRIRRAPK